MMHLLKGIQYKNRYIYALLTHCKFPFHYSYRFKLAAQAIEGATDVCDLCAGSGRLRHYLSPGVTYRAIESELALIRYFEHHHICSTHLNLFDVRSEQLPTTDTMVMIMSLYQFRDCVERLIPLFKMHARKIVIIESVLTKRSRMSTFLKRLRTFVCDRPYTRPTDVFLAAEFEELMERHGFVVTRAKHNHYLATYESRVLDAT